MNKRLLLSLACGLLAAPAATADIITVSPWHTAGNGVYTDAFGAFYTVPNVVAYHRAKDAFGAGPDTNQLVIQGLGFSDLQGVSYTGQPVANLSIQPVPGWTGGVSFYGFDLGVWQTPPLQRDVDYEIWNGDFSIKLASGTVNVGAVHATVNVALFSPNGFNVQFESEGVVAFDNYRVEGNDSAAPKPSISLSGNGVPIPRGDTTPDLTDHTDFGSPVLLGGAVTRTFTIANAGGLALNLTGTAPDFVTLTGSGDFAVTAQPAATTLTANGGTTTFAITFTPTGPGLKTATVSVASDDATKNPYTFAISGYWLGFSDGTVDRNFGSTGKVLADFGSNHNEYARAVAVQPDGKIVVAGTSVPVGGGNARIALARFTNAGLPDPTFGTGGVVITDISPQAFGEEANSVAVQPDGRILAGGFAWNGLNYDFLVLRYTATGEPDSGFGSGGIAMIPVGSGDDFGQAMALLSDGRILVAGHVNNGADYDVALVRLSSTGTLDANFGTNGKVVTQGGIGSNDVVTSMVLQPNDQIVVAGASFNGTGYDFTVLRYNPGGSLDGIFGAGGRVVTSLTSEEDRALAVRVQPDGKILLAGQVTNGGNSDFAVLRYSGFGILDSGFGSGGIVQTPIGSGNDHGRGMVLQSDGRILVAGGAESGGGYDFALARYAGNGTLDTTFGTGGKLTTSLSPSNDQGNALALLPDNRIVVAGEAANVLGNYDFAVAVYGLPLPNIAVAQAAPLTDGTGDVSVGSAVLGTTGPPITFTITNPGNGELDDLSVIKGGPDAGEFTVGPLSATSIPVGSGTVTFTVTFSPAGGSGVRNATLQIVSNVAGEKNPFDIALTGRALSFSDDSDGDGLNDAAEFQMAVMGFDWQVAQNTLVDSYYAAAAGAGFLTESQIQTQHGTAPLIRRDPDTGAFTLTIGVEKSTSLLPGSFGILPLTAPQVSIVNGQVELRFFSLDEKAFFRLTAE